MQSNAMQKYFVASAFRRNEGNFDAPTSRAWTEYFHEFMATVCISEYHRERAGGSQFRGGMEIRRSRRKSTLFEHVLKGWLDKDVCQDIAERWGEAFSGMGWKRG